MPASLRFIHIQSLAHHPILSQYYLSKFPESSSTSTNPRAAFNFTASYCGINLLDLLILSIYNFSSMPGTIQVSILELVGLPSSSMGIKVSVGKQAQETQDTGDFSFRLASLRDNLNVSIHDSEGNEIANTVVETRSIVEMGTWDDLFALKGGGHVHMKLHFILTDREQNRIRSMREYATQKKQHDLLKRRSSSSELALASGDSLKTARKAEQQYMNPADHHVNTNSAGFDAKVLGRAHPSQKIEAMPTSKSTGALDKLPAYRHVKEVIQPQDKKQKRELEKKPRNVRKMVLAFESSPEKDQEILPASNEMRSTPQLGSNNTTMDVPPKLPALKKTVSVKTKAASSSLETAPAPYPEQIRNGKVKTEDSRDPFREKLGQKTKQFKEYAMHSTDQTSSKENMSEMQRFGQKTDQFKELPTQSSDQMSSKNSASKIQEKVGEKIKQFKELQVQANDQISSKGIMSKVQKLGQKTEQVKELQNQSIDRRSSRDNMFKMQKLGQNIEQFKELGIQSNQRSSKDMMSRMQRGKEHSKEGKNSIKKLRRSSSYDKSKFGWETLVQAFQSRKKSDLNIGMDQKWKSKRWKSSQHRVKPKVYHEDEYYFSDCLHPWIFLDDTICSCIRSDDRPFIDIPEGRPRSPDTNQAKFLEAGAAPSDEGQSSVHSEESKSVSSRNNGAPRKPAGQAMKIAVMVGFGILVLFTRQRR